MPSLDNLSEFLRVAKESALTGGRIVKEKFGEIESHEVDKKGTDDFVTYVDKNSEEAIRAYISEKFPEHSFLLEEAGRVGDNEEYVWLIDPLDGTTNYIHGFPVVSVSIALQVEGITTVGVVYDPLREDMFYAVKDGGSYRDERKISVSQRDSLKYALLATGFPFRAKHNLDRYLKVFRELFMMSSGIRRAGSAALDLAYTACGVLDGFFEFGLSRWDIAAGALLVEEAGGVVTDFEGGDRFLDSGNVVAGSPLIHRELVKIIQGFWHK